MNNEIENNKANYDLHRSLIKKHLEDNWTDQLTKDVHTYNLNRTITGELLLRLMEYADEYSMLRIAPEFQANIKVVRDELS